MEMQTKEKTYIKASGIARGTRIPILTYHSIDESGSVISTSLDVFRRQMKSLAESGHEAISLSQLVDTFKNSQKFPTKAIVLTFDDGFQNFYTRAYPVLEQYDFKATVFLVTDFCGGYNDWAGNPPELHQSKLLSWSEIRELSEYGIDFGSHTRTHPDLTKLPLELIEAELSESKASIEDALGSKVDTFAYPFGKCDPAVREAAVKSFSAACSTNLGKVQPGDDFFSLRRIDSYYLKSRKLFDMLSSRPFDQYIKLRQAMRIMKSLLY